MFGYKYACTFGVTLSCFRLRPDKASGGGGGDSSHQRPPPTRLTKAGFQPPVDRTHYFLKFEEWYNVLVRALLLEKRLNGAVILKWCCRFLKGLSSAKIGFTYKVAEVCGDKPFL
ncbi:hypothetical protein P691DRAFT_839423 [Macrolepiota fuliginosa MF-IS2]|uniref:Uncharacterized protein n=1 Tax=Macrolepiota fuliginosa MF-IS2 TaxID=1400762 RepID=A0A9P6BZV7_9AGAR|nr:hypothetical protein P691DRAFT_839423 [Macrolepiota fuliginosa MF-IS2]